MKLISPPHEFFLKDPKLCILGLHDSDLVSLLKEKKLQDRPGSSWFTSGDFAVVRMEPLNNNESVIVHVYIATEFQQQRLLKYIVVDIVKYLKENTKYTKIFVPIPSPCSHVVRTMAPLGFSLEGVLPKSISWRNRQVDLIYYTRTI